MRAVIQTKDLSAASAWSEQAQQHADRRSFPRTIWTQKTKDITLPDLQVQVIDRHQLAKFLGQARCRDNRGPLLFKGICIHAWKSSHFFVCFYRWLTSQF